MSKAERLGSFVAPGDGVGASRLAVPARVRSPIYEPSTRPEAGSICVALRVDNLPHIEAAYGSAAADEVLAQLKARLHLISDRLETLSPTVSILQLRRRVATSSRAVMFGGAGETSGFARTLRDAVSLSRVAWEDQNILAAFSVVECVSNGDPVANAVDQLNELPFSGGVIRSSVAWAAQYRRDMHVATTLISDLESSGAYLAWEPVCNAARPDDLLYSEALLRMRDSNGAESSPAESILALERLGFIRPLDRYMVWRVIHELEADPEVHLGVNISAQSAMLDFWWDDLRRHLEEDPLLASRLVIEITESASIPSISHAVAFVAEMRRVGCRIALDDFGVGHASIRQVIALAPDIVKVDAFFLRRAMQAEEYRAMLGHLIGIARAFTGAVIVEGVESRSQSDLARVAGAVWQQGHFFGRSSLLRKRATGAAPAVARMLGRAQ